MRNRGDHFAACLVALPVAIAAVPFTLPEEFLSYCRYKTVLKNSIWIFNSSTLE